MKFIVPAKCNSTRIPNKNWREFSGGKSLVQICVEKLLPLGEVWVSCEDASKERDVARWGAGFHFRDKEMTDNSFPLNRWIPKTYHGIFGPKGTMSVETVRGKKSSRWDFIAPTDEPVGWAQVTSPLFNDYADMIARWESSAQFERYDSMVAVYPVKQYLLDRRFFPIDWGWGPWHTTGQNLPQMYQMPWVFSILTPESIRETGYHIGARPHWYVSKSPAVDIDTWDDWEYAKFLYEKAKITESTLPSSPITP